MKLLPRYRKTGTVLDLSKALYGLQKSPTLAERAGFSITSHRFMPLPHEHCCLTRDDILLFFMLTILWT